MAFNDIETSVEDGRPISFYAFTLNALTWRYTSADSDLTAGGFTWEAAAISDDGQRQTGETQNDAMSIVAPSWTGPAQVYMSGAPSKNIQVAILRKHQQDAEMVTEYIGEITQVNFPLPGTARITCETLASTMQREGLRQGWQRACPHTLYDPLTCRLDKSAWGIAFTVLTVNGYNVDLDTASALPTGHFNGGFMEWVHPIRGIEFLPVEIHTAAPVGPVAPGNPNCFLVLFGLPNDLYVGATGTIYPGCDFTPTRCQAFSNYDNYGGIPDMPGKSPFDGTPVF